MSFHYTVLLLPAEYAGSFDTQLEVELKLGAVLQGSDPRTPVKGRREFLRHCCRFVDYCEELMKEVNFLKL